MVFVNCKNNKIMEYANAIIEFILKCRDSVSDIYKHSIIH